MREYDKILENLTSEEAANVILNCDHVGAGYSDERFESIRKLIIDDLKFGLKINIRRSDGMNCKDHIFVHAGGRTLGVQFHIRYIIPQLLASQREKSISMLLDHD